MKKNFNSKLFAFVAIIFLVFNCTPKEDLPEEEPKPDQTLKNMVITAPIEIANTSIGISGGTIKVTKPNTPVDGLNISIPENSFSTVQNFKVSYAEIKSHQLGQYFNPVSPMFSIACDGGYSNGLISITIPIKIPEGHFPMGFYFDETTGKLEGIPVENYTSNTITLLTRHFLPGSSLHSTENTQKSGKVGPVNAANIIVCSLSESVLKGHPIISSGFKPGVDDWEFVNYGSYIEPDGHCAGQNFAAMWYYFEKKPTEGNLFNKFSDNANLWQDNSKGYRFCSVVQSDISWNGLVKTFFRNFIEKNQNLDKFKLNLIAGAMLITGEPQAIGIYMQTGTQKDGTPTYGGHALICYQVSIIDGKLFISDPNTPGTGQTINYKNDKFDPYNAKSNGNASADSYPYITYNAKTALIEWDKIGKRYIEVLNNTIGTNSPNNFPSYKIWVKDASTGFELKDGTIVTKDTLHTMVICPDAENGIVINNQKTIGANVYTQKGDLAFTQEGDYKFGFPLRTGQKVILKSGVNKLGYYIIGYRNTSKGQAGIFYGDYLDFKWVNVTYIPLFIEPYRLKGEPDKEYKFTARTKGAAPKNAKYVWDFGDGSAKTTILNDSTVIHKYTKEGDFTVKIELFDESNKLLNKAEDIAIIRVFKLNPVITSVSPNPIPVQSEVTIIGSGFGNTIQNIECGMNHSEYYYIGGIKATSWSDTKIVFTLPDKISCAGSLYVGEGYIKIMIPGVTASEKFKVTFGLSRPPVITSVSPMTTTTGGEITITGTNFGNVQGTVQFPSLCTCKVNSWSDTSITATIPCYFKPGTSFFLTVSVPDINNLPGEVKCVVQSNNSMKLTFK
jgi:hypothetical protein